MIKNIIFDVGNVLVDFDPEFLLRSWDIDDTARTLLYEHVFHSPIWNEYDRSTESVDEIKEHFCKKLPQYRSYIDEIFDSISVMHKTRDFVMPWLTELKKKGYRLYILSNYAQNTYDKTYHDLPFLEVMDGIVFSFQCHYIKPENEIYEHLLQTYNLVPSESVFIDDKADNIQKAKEYGIHGIIFTRYEDAKNKLKKLLG